MKYEMLFCDRTTTSKNIYKIFLMGYFISKKQRAVIVGILILLAYSMLTYTITGHKIAGAITDIISGLAVVGISLLMFPLFDLTKYKVLNLGYIISRIIEGVLMIIGGVFILIPSLEPLRQFIYGNVHIYFFILGAGFLYILFYCTQLIPKFISIWGMIATGLLLATTVLSLFGYSSRILDIILAPIILNEIFLALWLIIKGFKQSY